MKYVGLILMSIVFGVVMRKINMREQDEEYQLNRKRLTPRGSCLFLVVFNIVILCFATLLIFKSNSILPQYLNEAARADAESVLHILGDVLATFSVVLTLLIIFRVANTAEIYSINGLTFRYIDRPQEEQERFLARLRSCNSPDIEEHVQTHGNINRQKKEEE